MLCKPKPYNDEQRKVVIGYKNPLCLTRAKQVQHALYNGHEIIKTHHVPTIVHNSEDTLKIAEITRKKMNDKMKNLLWTKQNINIRPLDYLEDNYLVTFTPQTQLTPGQIFWSKDVLKMKTEALKEQTSASRPIKSLMVYPPNAPTMLVPRIITPMGLTEGERGFEQTKECYLIEVIPFFKTLKEHFEGIQKALTKEIKEMKDIFEELEAEVDQNVMNRKYDEIEQKNLLNANHNLIADCLSKEVFYIATISELTVSRFTEMHDAHIIVQARCLELEAKLSKLHDKVQKDDYTELVKLFPTLRYAIDVEPIPPHSRNNREVHLDYLKHLKESVETLHDIVEEAKFERPLDRSLASACLYTKHSQELLEYVISTCLKDFNKLDKKHASTPFNLEKARVNSCTDASGSKPRSNTKKNRISPAKSVNKKKVEEHPRTNKSRLKNMNRVDSSISFKHTVIQIVLWYLDSGCLKHMTGDRLRLRNFVKKFIRTVRFGNDHFGAIMGYGDYAIGDSVISRHSCYVRDTDGVDIIKGSRGSNLYTISVEDMIKSSPICLLYKASKNKSWLWPRCLNHLNFGTINNLARKDLVRGLPRLKFEKDHLCSACQLGKSKKHTYTPKTENTNLEVLNTLHIDLCGPMQVQTINGMKYIIVIVDD
ncbi:retrovirus-related pol polyprotein from transposon TNT 1-94 [Tanacetum coccineum]